MSVVTNKPYVEQEVSKLSADDASLSSEQSSAA